ncbi:MAG: hypothetical protein EOP04_32865, partial [Proteobacteria bacterium]
MSADKSQEPWRAVFKKYITLVCSTTALPEDYASREQEYKVNVALADANFGQERLSSLYSSYLQKLTATRESGIPMLPTLTLYREFTVGFNITEAYLKNAKTARTFTSPINTQDPNVAKVLYEHKNLIFDSVTYLQNYTTQSTLEDGVNED